MKLSHQIYPTLITLSLIIPLNSHGNTGLTAIDNNLVDAKSNSSVTEAIYTTTSEVTASNYNKMNAAQMERLRAKAGLSNLTNDDINTLSSKRGSFTDLSHRDHIRKSSHVVDAGYDNLENFGTKNYFTVNSGSTYMGIGVDAETLLPGAGQNNGLEIFGHTNDQADKTVEISMRTKSVLEGMDGLQNKVPTNNLLSGGSPIVGNVFRLHGMGIQPASADGRIKTDPFVLKMSYDQAEFEATTGKTELEEFLEGCLFVGWLNTGEDGNGLTASTNDVWVNAVQGNFDNWIDGAARDDYHATVGDGILGTFENYYGSTITSIEGLEKDIDTYRVGDFGADLENNILWAVVDHNSDFAVIPEPSTYATIFGSIIGLLTLIRRKLF